MDPKIKVAIIGAVLGLVTTFGGILLKHHLDTRRTANEEELIGYSNFERQLLQLYEHAKKDFKPVRQYRLRERKYHLAFSCKYELEEEWGCETGRRGKTAYIDVYWYEEIYDSDSLGKEIEKPPFADDIKRYNKTRAGILNTTKNASWEIMKDDGDIPLTATQIEHGLLERELEYGRWWAQSLVVRKREWGLKEVIVKLQYKRVLKGYSRDVYEYHTLRIEHAKKSR